MLKYLWVIVVIYKKLETKFLKSTLRYTFASNLNSLSCFLILILFSLGIFILRYIYVASILSLIIIILLLFFFIVDLLAMLWIYPFYFYKNQIKKNTEEDKELKISFSYKALREYLFDSSVDDLVQFLYEEKVTQKSKIELFIRHYESIKKVKLDFRFPLLVLLSLVLTIVVSLYALPVEQLQEALQTVILIIILMLEVYVALEFSKFLNKFVLNTNDKYNYLLSLLTEIYLTRYSGGHLLKKYPPKN